VRNSHDHLFGFCRQVFSQFAWPEAGPVVFQAVLRGGAVTEWVIGRHAGQHNFTHSRHQSASAEEG
jgi:hypothetical protein